MAVQIRDAPQPENRSAAQGFEVKEKTSVVSRAAKIEEKIVIAKVEIRKRKKLLTEIYPPEILLRKIPEIAIKTEDVVQPDDTIPVPVVAEVVQPQPNDAFNIAADPDAQELTISVVAGTFSSFNITDAAGKILMQRAITNAETTVDISALQPARYYINLKKGDKVKTAMFVKDK